MNGDFYVKPAKAENDKKNKKLSRNDRKVLSEQRKDDLKQKEQPFPIDNFNRKLQEIFPDHSMKQIDSSIQKFGKDFSKCYDYLVQIQPEGVSREQKLLDQLLQNIKQANVELTPQEFQMAFKQINTTLKMELGEETATLVQMNKDMQEFKINWKEDHIEGMTEEDMEARSGLNQFLQIFIQNQIKKKQNIKKFKDEDFPSLMSGSRAPVKAKEIFKNNQWAPKSVDLGLNDYDVESALDIANLNQTYSGMINLKDLKVIYSQLRDVQTSKRFIQTYFLDKGQKIRKIVSITERLQDKKPEVKKPVQVNYRKVYKVSQEVKKLTFEQLRNMVHHLMTVKYLYEKGAQRALEPQKSKLRRLAADKTQLLKECIICSRELHLKHLRKNNSQVIDLHGYYVQEVSEIVDSHIQHLRSIGKKCRLSVIVGKGLHSKNKKNVLGPEIERFCRGEGLEFKQGQGRIDIRLD